MFSEDVDLRDWEINAIGIESVLDANLKIFNSVKTIKAKFNARNPRTNEIIYVPEKKKISFKMSKHLKEEINK